LRTRITGCQKVAVPHLQGTRDKRVYQLRWKEEVQIHSF